MMTQAKRQKKRPQLSTAVESFLKSYSAYITPKQPFIKLKTIAVESTGGQSVNNSC